MAFIMHFSLTNAFKDPSGPRQNDFARKRENFSRLKFGNIW